MGGIYKFVLFSGIDVDVENLEMVTFPVEAKHDSVNVLGKMPIAAGFINHGLGKCFGDSKSLGIDAKPDISTPFLRLYLEKEE